MGFLKFCNHCKTMFDLDRGPCECPRLSVSNSTEPQGETTKAERSAMDVLIELEKWTQNESQDAFRRLQEVCFRDVDDDGNNRNSIPRARHKQRLDSMHIVLVKIRSLKSELTEVKQDDRT